VTDAAELPMVLDAIDDTLVVALDLETTGLDPRTDRVRLLSLGTDTVEGTTCAYLLDAQALGAQALASVLDRLADKNLVAHNAVFDLSFLARLGFTPRGKVHDTMLLAQLLVAGTYDRVGLADCCKRWLGRGLNKAERNSDWSGDEHHEAGYAARAYDLLVSDGLSPADDNLFRDMLWALLGAMELATHRMCNNHNPMQMSGRLPLAVALGDIPGTHDTLYGHQHNGQWRYGLIHNMRHDFLADGVQWEGSAGYHMLVLTMVYECFIIMEHLGVDLWHRQWPSLMQNDGQDEHRGWGPKGARPILAAFDAMLYLAFPNGDYSLLHDQILGNIRGTGVWGPIFNKAYEKFGLPRHAWVLRQIQRLRAQAQEALAAGRRLDGRDEVLGLVDHQQTANRSVGRIGIFLDPREQDHCQLIEKRALHFESR